MTTVDETTDKDKLIATLEQLVEARETQLELLEAILFKQSGELRVWRVSQQELAWRRYRDHLVDESPWGFALWLLLKDVWPFTLWYGRFERKFK